MEVVSRPGAKHPKLHHQQTNTQFFLQGGCPSYRPTNSIRALQEEVITFNVYPDIFRGKFPTQSVEFPLQRPPLFLQWNHHFRLSDCEFSAPPQETHPALGPRPRFSALRASFGSLPNSLHFPPMLRGLDKTLHHIPRICSPQAHLGIFRPYLDHWRLLVTSGEGCQASRRPSDASTPYYSSTKNLNNQACQSWWIVRI